MLRPQKRSLRQLAAISRQPSEHYQQFVFETRLPNSLDSVTSTSSSPFDHQIQTLAQAAIEPNRRLRDSDEIRLSAAKRTVDQNYYELDTYIDGDLRTNPVFICRADRVEEEGFETLRLLHNYLASLYSLNEAVRVLCNRYTPDGFLFLSGEAR